MCIEHGRGRNQSGFKSRRSGFEERRKKLEACSVTAGLLVNAVGRKDTSMWIVRLALNHPYTFVVLAILVLLLSHLMNSEPRLDLGNRIV